MKKLLIILGLVLATSALVPTIAKVNVNVNIGIQPAWGPVGYNYAAYYYFPDIDIYYNVNASMFVYWNGYNWVSARYLPYRYRNYDLYPMYKVVINEPNPWRYHNRHRRQYSSYRGYRNQPIILHSNDHRYSASRNNRVSWVNNTRSEGRASNNSVRSNNNSGRPHTNNRYNNSGRTDQIKPTHVQHRQASKQGERGSSHRPHVTPPNKGRNQHTDSKSNNASSRRTATIQSNRSQY